MKQLTMQLTEVVFLSRRAATPRGGAATRTLLSTSSEAAVHSAFEHRFFYFYIKDVIISEKSSAVKEIIMYDKKG